VHVADIRCDTDGDRGGGRRRSGAEGEDGASHEGTDRTDGQDCGCDDVTPNSHVYLHAFTEVKCLDPGFGGPTDLLVRQPVFG
jgi:hypothetical protein